MSVQVTNRYNGSSPAIAVKTKNSINDYPPPIKKKQRNENDTVNIDNTSWIENVGYNLDVFI
jgi:hypothetical protein